MKQYKTALHIFRRDLRLQDNTALQEALKNATQVIPCFILDPRQVSENKFKSDNAIEFMLKSLEELNAELSKKKSELYIFHGQTEQILKKIKKEIDIDLVTFNHDYTPFSKKRDEGIIKFCQKEKIECLPFHDALLHEPDAILKSDKTPYKVFTPYLRSARKKKIREAARNSFSNYYSKKIKSSEPKGVLKKFLKHDNKNIKVKGGRKEGVRLLKKATSLKDYKTLRDFPKKDNTTHLSAHNKFGTVSIREVYYVLRKARQSDIITELHWRDFFTKILYYFPHALTKSFQEKYDKITWSKSEKNFTAWKEGKTGFPIVDAGIRELNATGYMHNRVRMITASFLVKDLHINWQWGEKYFAQKLVDYDPAVNNGNWQWVASTGCDAQPYFRIFNPWSQQKKFDPDCIYIKKWVPELKNISPKEIHNLFKNDVAIEGYPTQIVEHKAQAVKTKKLFQS